MARINVVEAENIIKIGQRIDLMLEHDKEERYYSSRIEDIDDRCLSIAMPLDQGYPIIPTQGETLFMRLRSEEGMFKFTSSYVSKSAVPIPMLRIVKPQEMEKHQQREFVRVNVQLPLKVRLEMAGGALSAPYYTNSLDISGGGIRFVMNTRLHTAATVHIETGELPAVGVLDVACEVVRCVASPTDNKIFWVGTKFIKLPNPIQRNLIRFIFQKQREQLMKRLPD